MVVLNRIYTRTGDDGTTALGSGERRPKYDLRVSAYGTVDETNAAIGIDVRRRQWQGFMLAGAFAGVAGALFAFSKGSISPETLAIPRSIDVLVMVLLGGLNALFGPLIGAAAFTWLQDTLARVTEYWRAFVGAGILILVLAFPQGLGALGRRLRRR